MHKLITLFYADKGIWNCFPFEIILWDVTIYVVRGQCRNESLVVTIIMIAKQKTSQLYKRTEFDCSSCNRPCKTLCQNARMLVQYGVVEVLGAVCYMVVARHYSSLLSACQSFIAVWEKGLKGILSGCLMTPVTRAQPVVSLILWFPDLQDLYTNAALKFNIQHKCLQFLWCTSCKTQLSVASLNVSFQHICRRAASSDGGGESCCYWLDIFFPLDPPIFILQMGVTTQTSCSLITF